MSRDTFPEGRLSTPPTNYFRSTVQNIRRSHVENTIGSENLIINNFKTNQPTSITTITTK